MLAPLQKAVDEIKASIPRQILEQVFVERNQYLRGLPISLDETIINKVLRPRVLVDCNLVGGTEVLIPLYNLQPFKTSDNEYVYRIPKERTQNRSINSVLSISFSNSYRFVNKNHVGLLQATGAAGIASKVVNAASSIPLVSTDRVQLIGENTVLFYSPEFINTDIVLRAILAHDENMAHLQLRSYLPFSALCVLAVKAYIYNELVITMDMGQLSGGQSLGRFKEIVDGYADSNELYATYLREKWTKISLMNDKESFSRFKKTLFGNIV